MKPEDVPEEVIITGIPKFVPAEYGGTRVFILEDIPKSWSVSKTSKLSVSDKHSKAGVRSIRWDWEAGDVLRIRDLKGLGNSSLAPVHLSVLLESPLPDNTQLNIYYQMGENYQVDERFSVKKGTKTIRPFYGNPQSHYLARETYHMHYENWYMLGFSSGARERYAKHYLDSEKNYEWYTSSPMPEGVPEPEVGELVIQAPTTVKQGTFYLDRLMINLAARESGSTRLDSIREGKPAEPFPNNIINGDAHGFTSYYGLYAQHEESTELLTKQQKAYVERAKADVEADLDKHKPQDPVKAKKEIMEALSLLEKKDNGDYVFPAYVNLMSAATSGDRVFFGDVTPHAGKSTTLKGAKMGVWLNMRKKYEEWFLMDPEFEPAEKLLKAFLDWSVYQGVDVDKQGGTSMHRAEIGRRGYKHTTISILNEQDKRDGTNYGEMAYRMTMWYDGGYMNRLFKDERGAVGEVGKSAMTGYRAQVIGTDEQIYQQLVAYRNRWENHLAISDFGARLLFKPDYTFFHHGHTVYWGANYPGFMNIGKKFANTPNDISNTAKKTLAMNNIMYYFTAVANKSISPWPTNRFGQPTKGIGVPYPDEEMGDEPLPHAFHNHDDFPYLYNMDWEEVPAAEKCLSALFREYAWMPELYERIKNKYPKLKDVKLTETFHKDLNWSAATVHVNGLSQVFVKGYNSMSGAVTEPEGCPHLWQRGLGSLFIREAALNQSDPVTPQKSGRIRAGLGENSFGYDWSRTSGVTAPRYSIEESASMEGGVLMGVSRLPISKDDDYGYYSGAVNFGETDTMLGSAGNFALMITPENHKLGKLFPSFRGKKTYHFVDDQVICLGSGYSSDTDGSMQTTLFQRGVDEEWLSSTDKRRWDAQTPSVVVNGKSTKAAFRGDKEWQLTGDNYIISPYGHAWLIPEGQSGRLGVSWKKQTSVSYHAFRFDERENADDPFEMGRFEGEGDFITAWWDHGAANETSDHHYCLLLNAFGKSPSEFEAYIKGNQAKPRYHVLRQDDVAHAVVSPEQALFSYVIFTPNQATELPYVSQTNRRLNIMVQPDEKANTLNMAVCDAALCLAKNENDRQSPLRTVKITLGEGQWSLVGTRPGLPCTNQPLNARIENGNTLVCQTRNAVTDQFKLKLSK